MVRRYTRKSDNSLLEFESVNYKTIIMRGGTFGSQSTEVSRKEFDNWHEGEKYFNQLIIEQTRFASPDSIKKLKNGLLYDDQSEDFMSIDLSPVSIFHYEDHLPDGSFKTDMGEIKSKGWLITYTTWAIIFDAIREGIRLSIQSPAFKAFSKHITHWTVTAGEHGQLECVVARIENGKMVEPPAGETFYIEHNCDAYHSLHHFFANTQITYPKEILLHTVSENLPPLMGWRVPDVSALIEDVCDSFTTYFEDADKEELAFELIHLEWYAGDAEERFASAYPYKKNRRSLSF